MEKWILISSKNIILTTKRASNNKIYGSLIFELQPGNRVSLFSSRILKGLVLNQNPKCSYPNAYRLFPQSLQTNIGAVSQNKPRPLSSNPGHNDVRLI